MLACTRIFSASRTEKCDDLQLQFRNQTHFTHASYEDENGAWFCFKKHVRGTVPLKKILICSFAQMWSEV